MFKSNGRTDAAIRAWDRNRNWKWRMKFVMNQLERMCIKSHKQFLLVMQRMASLWNELFCLVMQMFSSGSPFYRTNITENRKSSLSLSALKFKYSSFFVSSMSYRPHNLHSLCKYFECGVKSLVATMNIIKNVKIRECREWGSSSKIERKMCYVWCVRTTHGRVCLQLLLLLRIA